MRKSKQFLTYFLMLTLLMMFILPVKSNAFSMDLIEQRASYYLNSYNAYVYPAGGSKIQVYFSVTGTDYMDELGTLSIQIYECSTNSSDINEWTWKKTFTHDSTTGMLSYNDDYHSGHVDYYGTAGKYYKAYVCIWGGKNGNGDTRYFWTSAKQAT